MKILYIVTLGGTMRFFNNFIQELVNKGHEIEIACNAERSPVPDCYYEWQCKIHNILCTRSPFNVDNIVAIKQIRNLVSKNQYDIVHCHTPIAAFCTRIACRKVRKQGTKVFYTAHGFHFYKGAPLKNWLMYYPIEKLCAYWTDVLITINKEDYALAKKKMKAKRVEYVPGVGIDLQKFNGVVIDKEVKRQELGIPKDAILLLSVGELNENKNHETVIRAIADMDVYYIIAGSGQLKDHLQSIIDKFGMTNRVKLLGFRSDVRELCAIADIFVFPSFREGLSVSVMEAMASGLPVVCSRIRGNIDLVDENGGALFDPYSIEICKSAIAKVSKENRIKMKFYNKEKIQKFGLDIVKRKMDKIYREDV